MFTLHNGDCLPFMRSLQSESFDCIVTDPPYGLGDKWTGGTWFTKNVYENDDVAWDVLPSKEIMDCILSFNKPSVIWGGNYFTLPPSRCWLSWSKINSMPTMSDIELAWTNFDKPAKQYRSLRNGWERQHPTEKPIGLMKWVIENYTNIGDTVFDPFMGSGTTGVACVETGRHFIGCEISAEYFAIAEKRVKSAVFQPSFLTPSNNRLHLDVGDSPAQQALFTPEAGSAEGKSPTPAPRR